MYVYTSAKVNYILVFDIVMQPTTIYLRHYFCGDLLLMSSVYTVDQ